MTSIIPHKPTPDERLSPREDAGPDPLAQYDSWVEQARESLDTGQLDQAAAQLYSAFVERANAENELSKEIDRAAYQASQRSRDKINTKRAELRATHEANVDNILDKFDAAAESVEACRSTEVTQADLPIPKGAVHAAMIDRMCSQFSRLTPTVAIGWSVETRLRKAIRPQPRVS